MTALNRKNLFPFFKDIRNNILHPTWIQLRTKTHFAISNSSFLLFNLFLTFTDSPAFFIRKSQSHLQRQRYTIEHMQHNFPQLPKLNVWYRPCIIQWARLEIWLKMQVTTLVRKPDRSTASVIRGRICCLTTGRSTLSSQEEGLGKR